MKPPLFSYFDPRSVEEAVNLLAEYGSDAALLAGGQSLMPLLNLRLARPEVVIDINRIPGLDGIEVTDSGVKLGSLARMRAVERAPEVRSAAPALTEAVACVAHPQIRARTTVGGNIAHADPSSELPGVLAAFDGRVELTSRQGSRWMSWSDFFVTVFTTAREPEEMVTRVEFPRSPGFAYSFREIARRPGDYPLAGVCIGLHIENDAIIDARVAVVAVADRPVRLGDVEDALAGCSPHDAKVQQEVRALAESSTPASDDAHGSARFRRGLIGTLIADALADWEVAA